jgi:7,8-dihydropterin-6-yl-methyl-4-(beta-D-ribofuranosyl)aminobenzene 5'-phosphate synthase
MNVSSNDGELTIMTFDFASKLIECDAVHVHVLVDNVSDILSTAPPTVTPHIANLVRKKPGIALTGTCLCCANWGLALAIEIECDQERVRIMFDAGPDRASLKRNAALLGCDLTTFDAVVLSHGHWDHAGGLMEPFVQQHKQGIAGSATEFHANDGMFVRRGMRMASGQVLPFRDPPTPDRLKASGAHLVIDDNARVLGKDFAYLSDEVPRVTDYEIGLPGHVARPKATKNWIDDPLIMDERWLAVHVRSKGIVIFSACSHAGIINVLRHAKSVFADIPIYAVMGGLHLSGAANEAIIDRTVSDMAVFNLTQIVPGHCTGWRAVNALEQSFGDRVIPLSVGQTHTF